MESSINERKRIALSMAPHHGSLPNNQGNKRNKRKGKQRIIHNPKHDSNIPENNKSAILWWNSPSDFVPVESEESMIDVLVRWKKTERGMIKDQPPFRLAEIRKQLKRTQGSISLHQALSLRRHHMKHLNPTLSMAFLRLGDQENINSSAKVFEGAVESFLKKRQIEYWTENEQKERFPKEPTKGEKLLTPDFLFPNAVLIKKVRGKDRKLLEERTTYWLEAKMFYGASTIPHGSPGAVGSILPKMKQYVEAFGEGAIVFMHGCGDRLASDLANIGVIVLDCSCRNGVSLRKVHASQRTWCANENGEILP